MLKVADMLSESSSSSDSDIYLPGFFALPSDAKFMDSRTVYQAYRGRLRIIHDRHTLAHSRNLTPSVIHGRNLHSENFVTCDSYIKVSLNPDVEQSTLCNTEPIPNNNNPLFDEKFSFELLEDDGSKRLYISVWNHIDQSDHEFLGAMSFGLHNINSEIRGWFYLLMGELGLTKHLRYNGKKLSTNRISSINADVKWMDSYSMVLKKKNGFGFSLNGSSPVYVSRINSGSAAEECGLKKGDCFVRIGGMNVSRSSSDSVARILRQSVGAMRLEVQRPREIGSNRPSSSRISHAHSSASSRQGQTSDCSSPKESGSPKQRIEKLSVSPWRPTRRQAEGQSRPISFISQMSNSSQQAAPQAKQKSRLPPESHYIAMHDGKPTNHRAVQPLPQHPGVKGQRRVDYGWVDSDGYVQRSQTLPRRPQLQQQQLHGGFHEQQSRRANEARPLSYHSGQRRSSEDEEPHYEVIPDGYYRDNRPDDDNDYGEDDESPYERNQRGEATRKEIYDQRQWNGYDEGGTRRHQHMRRNDDAQGCRRQGEPRREAVASRSRARYEGATYPQQRYQPDDGLDYRDMNVYKNVQSMPRQRQLPSSRVDNGTQLKLAKRPPPPPPTRNPHEQQHQRSQVQPKCPRHVDIDDEIDYIDADDDDEIEEIDNEDMEYSARARRHLALTLQFPSHASLSQSEIDLIEAQAEFQKTCPLSPQSPQITRYILNTPRATLANINKDSLYKRSAEMSEISKRFYNRASELKIVKNDFKMPVKTPIRPIMERYMDAQKENIY